MESMRCAMCASPRLIAEAERDTAALVDAYRRRFDIDVSKYFDAEVVRTWRCFECDLRTHAGGRPGDSAFYDAMQRHPFYYEREKPEFSYALDRIVELKPARVLEVGCGEGNFLRKLRGAVTARGSELSESSLAKLKAAGIELDTAEDRYDFVCAFQVLEHVPDVDAFVGFMVSKLQPGGHLLVTVPNRDSKYVVEGTASVLDFPPHHMTQWSKLALSVLAPRYGLQPVHHYEEPMRATHLAAMLSVRRAQIPAKGRVKEIGRLAGRLADLVLAPYHLDRIDYGGVTHGVLLRKPG